MSTTYRIFPGAEATKPDDEGEPADPTAWYYEPIGWDGDYLFSEACDSEEEAREMVKAEVASEEEATL